MADIKKMLETLLGKQNASDVREVIKEAKAVLDGAGIQRKQDEGEGDSAGGEAILDAVENAGAAGPALLVKSILDALAGDALTALEDKLGGHEAVVTLLLKAVSGSPEESPAAETPPMEAAMMSLKDYIAASTKDMGDMARGQLDIAKAVKDITSQNADLQARIKTLEDQLDDRPRQASKAKETEIVDTGKDGKKAKEAIQKSLNDTEIIAGIRVKKTA